MSCTIFSLGLLYGWFKTMGTTSDILHYHPTNDNAWSLSQCYIESTCLWKCKPTVPNICLLDRTSDQVKVSNYRLIVGVLALYQFGTSSESKLQDIYYSWYYREPSQEGFFAIRKRTRSDSNLELLENQEDLRIVQRGIHFTFEFNLGDRRIDSKIEWRHLQ